MTVEELEVLVLALAAQVARLETRFNALYPEEPIEEDQVAAGFRKYRARAKEREG